MPYAAWTTPTCVMGPRKCMFFRRFLVDYSMTQGRIDVKIAPFDLSWSVQSNTVPTQFSRKLAHLKISDATDSTDSPSEHVVLQIKNMLPGVKVDAEHDGVLRFSIQTFIRVIFHYKCEFSHFSHSNSLTQHWIILKIVPIVFSWSN